MLKEYATEIKVGALVFAAIALAVVFLWFLGDYTPIGRTYNVYALYDFAGGVELGTPVRVSGVKVGKVTDIKFLPPDDAEARERDVSLRLKLNISRTVRSNVRADSQFFINQAGIIGERYIEITTGGASAEVLEPGAVVRGVDPPRFDQLLSQGLDVFGQVADILERNREGLRNAADAMERIGKMLKEVSSRLDDEDVEKVGRIIGRLDSLSADMEVVAGDLRTQLGPTLREVRTLARDADPVVKKADRLLGDFDSLAQEIRNLPEKDKKEIKGTLARMTDTARRLQDVVTRLDAFTIMVENQYSDIDREKLERMLREFFQEEGVKINVGEIKFRSKSGAEE